jgi:hypothetical protein
MELLVIQALQCLAHHILVVKVVKVVNQTGIITITVG